MKILTDLQERVLVALFAIEDIKKNFYLTGGTALSAYYLKHRVSDDIDIFTHTMEVEPAERMARDGLASAGFKVESLLGSPTFKRFKINDVLKLDMVKDVDFRVGSPQLIEGIMVDSKKNIAVNKVSAVYSRLDPKDYVDLFFLLRDGEFDILNLLSLARQKDAGLEFFQWAKIITDAETISILPKMVVPCDLQEVKEFFKKLRGRVIDSLNPRNR